MKASVCHVCRMPGQLAVRHLCDKQFCFQGITLNRLPRQPSADCTITTLKKGLLFSEIWSLLKSMWGTSVSWSTPGSARPVFAKG